MEYILIVLAVATAGGIIAVFWHGHQERKRLYDQLENELQKASDARLELMKEKVARQKAQQALQSKRLLMNNLSQDILRYTLSVSGVVEILDSQNDILPKDERAYLMQQLKENCRQVIGLVGRSLELSQTENSCDTKTMEEVRAKDLCEGVMEKYKHKISKGVQLVFANAMPDDYIINMNKPYVERILNILLDNAVRHTTSGVIQLTFSKNRKKQLAIFTVTDTCHDLPDQYWRTVFERLPEKGYEQKITGLGLMICKTLVKRMDGTIYIDSNYREGTRVVFDIKE